MTTLAAFELGIGSRIFAPLMIGGMGVDISTAELANAASIKGAIGHISDAMVQYVSDRRYGTNFSSIKSKRFKSSVGLAQKPEVKFDLEDLRTAQLNHVQATMSAKRGPGSIFINIMEKLSMAAPIETLKTRLVAALDGGIDGITLSAGLHTSSIGLIADHPRFRDAAIGIIVSSLRALKIFLRSAAREQRLPDYIVVEGPLAGGHLGFGEDWKKFSLRTIVREVVEYLKQEKLKIPVIGAGGIFTGADAVELIGDGAAGVQVATRFTVTHEAGLPADVKQKYLAAQEEDVVVNNASPTGYLMRMLKNSPCLSSSVRPTCEAFGYMLSREGRCAYIDAYNATPAGAAGEKLPVKDKICLCYHFSKSSCYTCGSNVYRLKDKTARLADGSYALLSAAEVIDDYLNG